LQRLNNESVYFDRERQKADDSGWPGKTPDDHGTCLVSGRAVLRLIYGVVFLLIAREALINPCFASAGLGKFEIEGRAELEVDARYRRSEFQKQLELDLKTGGEGPIRAAAELELTHEAGDARLKELHLSLDTGYGWLSVGQRKKRFGLDSDLGARKRLTLTRGMFFQKLGNYSYVGTDSAIEFQFAKNDDSRWKHCVSLHSSEGMTVSGLYEGNFRVSEAVDLTGYSLYQGSSLAHQWNYSRGQFLSLQANSGGKRLQVELFIASDPWETAHLRAIDKDGTIWMSGGSIGGAWKWGMLSPYVKLALLKHDLKNPQDQTWELTPGLRYWPAEHVELGSEFRYLTSGSNLRIKRGLPFDSGSTLTLAARYYF